MSADTFLCYVITIISILYVILLWWPKTIKTEIKNVQATVANVDYRREYITTVRCGMTTNVIHHSARYYIKIKYNNLITTIDNRDIYEKYKNNIGGEIDCKLITKTYDNGKTYSYLKWVKD